MTDVVIQAENLGKKYTIGHQAENGRDVALRDVLMQNTRSFWRTTADLLRGKPIIQGNDLEEVWALKDVSFEIRRGEIMGITEPSAGRVTIEGRVASLLETCPEQGRRGGHGLSPRVDRAGEHLPQRRNFGDDARRGQVQVRRDCGLRGERALPEYAREALLQQDVRAAGLCGATFCA